MEAVNGITKLFLSSLEWGHPWAGNWKRLVGLFLHLLIIHSTVAVPKAIQPVSDPLSFVPQAGLEIL